MANNHVSQEQQAVATVAQKSKLGIAPFSLGTAGTFQTLHIIKISSLCFSFKNQGQSGFSTVADQD